MAFSTGLHQAGLFQDPHVMRNRRLRQLDALLNIACTKPSAFFFQHQQNPSASRVGNSVQKTIKIGSGGGHLVIV